MVYGKSYRQTWMMNRGTTILGDLNMGYYLIVIDFSYLQVLCHGLHQYPNIRNNITGIIPLLSLLLVVGIRP
jgi:hypothetical protein